MGEIDKLKFRYWDDVGAIVDVIKKWRPRGCKKEKDYENSLSSKLRENFPGLQITKQYAKGRIRADLLIDEKVIVEIKHNLYSTTEYLRLIGQLIVYNHDWSGRVLLLLTGKPDPSLVKDLERIIKKEGLDSGLLLMERGKVTVLKK